MSSVNVRITDCPLCQRAITGAVTHMTNGNTHLHVEHVCVTPTINPKR